MGSFVDQILVVIEPLLIDEDYYARVEGREIISNLAKVRFWCLFACVILDPFSIESDSLSLVMTSEGKALT